MNEEDVQLAAATSTQANLLVIAPPGCGKTELLALRARVLIDRLSPNQKILALTFSNKAKENLSDRIRRVVGIHRFRRFVRVRNFHGHAAEIVRSHGRTIGVDPRFPMPGKNTLSRAIRKLTEDREQIRTIEDVLRRIKQAPRDDNQVLEALHLEGNTHAVQIERERVAAGLLHYDDLLRHAQRLLQIKEVANLYQQHYGAVLVDEFQDLSLQQLEIALLSCSDSRTFVGDPLQGIYTWAGARPREVESKLREICGEPFYLNISYRSSPAVLTVLNSVSTALGAKPLEAAQPTSWPEGGASAAIVFDHGTQEAAWIAGMAARILERDPQASIGIIAREGWRRKSIDTTFAARRDLHCIRWDLAIDDPAILERLRAAADQLPKTADVAALEDKVLADVDPTDVETYGQVVEAIDQLRDAAEQAGSLSAALAQLNVRHDHAVIGPGVHLLNAHIGKGQQFDWVFIPGLEEFHVPSGQAETADEIAEEQRVLLVMLSRARHGVVVTRAKQLTSKQGRLYHRQPSRWWTDIEGACSMHQGRFEAHVDGYARA